MRKSNAIRQVASKYKNGEYEWIKHYNTNGSGGFCMRGALREILGLPKASGEDYIKLSRKFIEYNSVLNQLANIKEGNDRKYGLTYYNDKICKSKAEAIKFLREAADIYDKRESSK